jgi:hypothetical protein
VTRTRGARETRKERSGGQRTAYGVGFRAAARDARANDARSERFFFFFFGVFAPRRADVRASPVRDKPGKQNTLMAVSSVVAFVRVDGRRARGLGSRSRVRVLRSRASPRRGHRARDARLGSGGSKARWVARQARSRKRHAPFGAVALRIFCDPRVTRAALVHDAERDAAASRAPSASLRAVARVQPAQTRPAFATARTGARARTDPLETRTPRAVPIGTGAVTRHAPSVAASIASSSLLVSKGGRLESRRPAGRRGRVCGRREEGGDWVSFRPTRPRKSSREKAIFFTGPNETRTTRAKGRTSDRVDS